MSTKGRENWEKFKAGYVIDSSYAEEPSTGNAGRDRWNALKKTIDIRSTAPQRTKQEGSYGAEKGFFDRLGLTVSGGAKGSLAGNMDAMGVAYEAGQSGRTKRDTAELKDAQWAVARAKHDYDADPSEVNKSALGIATTKMKAFADVLGEGAYEQALEAAYDAAAQFDTGDLKALYNSLGVVTPKTGTGVQQQAAKAARDLAVRVQDSATEDIREAKDGTSKFWQMAIDAGASATQMALDAASNAVLGTKGSMVPFATRAFGGATMEARQGGADLGKQALYGAAQTAKEVFTEKMFNIALPYAKTYGKGGFDGIVENGIRKAADKLGKSKIGKAALEKVLTFGASAATEGMEELIGDWMEWQLPRIYGGDVATAEETLSDSLYDFVVGSMSGMIGGAMTEPMKTIDSAVQAQEVKKAYGAQQWDLVNESEELSPGNELAKKYRERLDGGKNLSGRQLIRLMQQNETDMLNGDKAKIQAATEKRLTELGESDNVRQLAEIAARQMAGEELSRDEQMQIDGSKYGKRVLDELNPENVKVDENGNPRDTYSSSWTGSIGTSVIDPVTFNRNIGVTGAKYNPETQKLDAIVKDSEGNIQTVPLEEAKASPMQEELFDWAEELKEAGPVMVGAYQATQNLELYAKSFRLAYEYGKAHVPMDYVENSEAVNYLHPVQLKLAYEEGEKAQQRQTQAAEKKINSGGTRAAGKKKPAVSLGGATVGGTTYAPVDRKTLNRRQWAAVEAMRTFSKATGVDVVFYQSQANEKGRYEGANGFYRDGTIYLDINAGRNSTQDVQETAVLKTAAHELTHFIQQNSPTQYEELKQFVVEKLTREEGISFDDLVTDKQRREYGLSYEEAVDEVVADACEMMLKDSKAVEQLARENRSLAERIRQWIRKWVRSLKAAMEGLTADRPESRAMMQYAQELQEIWDNALVDAARNGRGTMRGNAPAENRQSIRETSDGKKYVKADRQVLFGSDPDSWSEQLEDYINGKIRRGQNVPLIAEDGDILLLTRTSAGKLSDNHTSDGRTMSDAAFERKANAAAHIDELVKVSSKGKKTVIDKDARHGDMASGGWNYRTAYFMDFDGKYYKTTISVADGSGGSVIYNVGHMKEEAFPKIKGSYAEKGNGPRGNASDSSIRQSNDNSQEKSSDKVQFSMRDSAGRELTKAQQAYFKDSKVRDAEGNLLVMYHQTDGTFTVFDTKHKGAGAGDDETPFGIFLKRTSRNIGVRGEKQMELYADIRNPLRVRDRTELVSKLRELSVDYARLKDKSAQIDKEYGAKFEEAKNAFKSFLIQWRKNNPDAPPRAAYDADGFDAAFNAEDNVVKEWTRAKDELALRAKTSITQALRDNGYDGVILENDKGSWGRSTEAYIALNAEQVKNIDNLTPTKDLDIRFSRRDKYWRPSLSGDEWSLLNRRMDAEIQSEENFVDESTKWVYADEKGVQVFALYGIGDGTEATPLYAVSGEKATACKADMTDYMEEKENADRNGQSVDSWVKQFRSKKRSRGGNLSKAKEQAGTAGTVYGLHGGQQERYSRGTAERGAEDQRGVTVQNQQREPRLSDRDVLRMAARMAQNDRSNRWAVEDKNRLELLERRMLLLDEINAELAALQEERATILSGRKKSELKGEDRNELIKTENRIQIAKDQIEREEARAFNLVSMDVYKPLLKKARSIVEQDVATRARTEYREKREAAEQMAVTRRKVERNAKRLLEYMNTNTDKKHIPEALKKPIGELLESLNFFSNSARRGGYTSRADLKYYEAMQGLQAALATQRAFDDTGEGTDVFKGYLDLPAGFESLLAVHVERVKNVVEKHPLKTDVLKMMDLGDLRDLDVILSVMSRSVTKMNEMFIKRRFAYVADAAEDSIFAMQRLGQHQDKPGERFALWDNTLPWYAFQRFGEGGKAVFEGLQDGWDKLAFNMKTILDFRQGLISDALARKWDTETHKVELTDPDGSTATATLTTAQLMSLYCLSKRKQALGHLLGGGIRPDAIEVTNTLGDKIKKKKLNQDKQFKLTEESLGQLLKLLTPEQIKVADAMQKFMTEQGSAWGNAISMERFGYRAFTEQNYFPIETDRQDREAKTGDAKEGSLYRLQNISAVKPLVKNANNALILRGIFDVFANHTADMAKYNAMVLPIIDAQKWYNYRYGEKNEAGQVYTRTVQRAMTKAYGEVANNFVIKYLQDLNGVRENGDRGDTIPKRMISNYKRAMVAANMRVALLQPTAYARASAVLDYKYLLKAFKDKTGTKQATKEMMENSGIALWKSLGFFDTDVGRSIRDQIKGKSSKIDDLVDKTMVPAEKGDEVTWARLWRACKLEVQDKQHLTGEELLNATAERFREVIYRTQVVDSTMTRSHAMRGSGTLTKMATSFMSEPTVSYNMVMESTRQIAEDAKRMGLRTAIRRNWKTAGRSYQAYIVSAIVTAIVESLYDALRDSDDDKYLDKVWKALGGEKPETVKDGILDVIFGLNGNLAGDINPIGKVPYLRDVVSILGGYSNGRMDTEAVANLKKAIDIWDEVIRLQTGDLDKATKTTYYGNMTTYGMIYPTAKALSQLTGLPGSAAMREVATAWNTTVGAVWPALKMRTYEDKKLREAWENYGKDSGVSYAVMYRAIQDLKEIESDRDADGNAISGSLKAKYVEYIRGMGLTRAQEKAVWEAAKNSSWSDKGTPWG